MTPSLKKKLGSTYRPYFLLLSVLTIAICIGLLVCASVLKDYDSNLKDQLFHIWVAIPVRFCSSPFMSVDIIHLFLSVSNMEPFVN